MIFALLTWSLATSYYPAKFKNWPVAQIWAEPLHAIAEFWTAIAGPMTNFALALIFGLLQHVIGALAPVLALAKYLAYINATLALFNLIPGFPLDGGRVFRAMV